MEYPDQEKKGLGLRLKSARQRKGLTQQQVADWFGLKTKATVSAWEVGTNVPDALQLKRLAKLYDISGDALLWEDSLTPHAMKIAAEFDGLTDKQQKLFEVMWGAYFAEAATDEQVEAAMPAVKARQTAKAPTAAHKTTGAARRAEFKS